MTQDAFNDWWGSDYDDSTNPCMTDSFEYWAWEGWHAALALTSTKCKVQPAQEPDTYRSVPHGHCTHPRCKEVFSAYIEANKRLAHYEPEGKSPMILNAAPPQRPWVGLMRGVRVEGDTVVIKVQSNNEERLLCSELVNEMGKNT